MPRYVARWIAPLAKSAGITPEAVYSLFNARGYHAPYDDEYKGLTIMRASGHKCTRYKPTENAMGKSPPSFIKKGAKPNGAHANGNGSARATTNQRWSDKLLLTRLAKLLPGGPDTKTKNRIRYYLKMAGHTDVRKMDEATALAVLEGRGINISGFEYARAEGTPASSSSAKLIPDPAENRELLLTQYKELGTRLEEALAAVAEKDAKIGVLTRQRTAVRQMLQQYHDQLLPVAKARFGGIMSPLEYPLTAYSKLMED